MSILVFFGSLLVLSTTTSALFIQDETFTNMYNKQEIVDENSTQLVAILVNQTDETTLAPDLVQLNQSAHVWFESPDVVEVLNETSVQNDQVEYVVTNRSIVEEPVGVNLTTTEQVLQFNLKEDEVNVVTTDGSSDLTDLVELLNTTLYTSQDVVEYVKPVFNESLIIVEKDETSPVADHLPVEIVPNITDVLTTVQMIETTTMSTSTIIETTVVSTTTTSTTSTLSTSTFVDELVTNTTLPEFFVNVTTPMVHETTPALIELTTDQSIQFEFEESHLNLVNETIPIVNETVSNLANVSVSSLNDTKQILAVCESTVEFKYYQPHPTDRTKYIKCNPWGTGLIIECNSGSIWNEWSSKCDLAENFKNVTFDFSTAQVLSSVAQVTSANCSLVECLNGGVCVDFKCKCGENFAGELCETQLNQVDITVDILNGTFSLEKFKLKLAAENVTLSASYYESFKDQLDNVTYAELMNYISFYGEGQIRYDTLVISLVEDILQDIFQDAEYLSIFNASEQSLLSTTRMIPSLLSYSRYSLENHEILFGHYQKILDALVVNLNSSQPNVTREAALYSKLTSVFLNQTESEQSFEAIKLDESQVKVKLNDNLNLTLVYSERLLDLLSIYQSQIIDEIAADEQITLGYAKFQGAADILNLLDRINLASGQVWDALVNYGFWYMTNLFAASKPTDIKLLN